MSGTSTRTLEDVLKDSQAAAARARESQARERKSAERAENREQIHQGQLKITENVTIERQIANLKRISGWESDTAILASIEELVALRSANAEELTALGDNADIAAYNLRVETFGEWVSNPNEEGKSTFAFKIDDVRAYSSALHSLLEVTDHEKIDEGAIDLTERVTTLRGEIAAQIEKLSGKNKGRELPKALVDAQAQLAALDPSTLANEMELFNRVPYLSNQTMRCMCPRNECGQVKHSVTIDGKTTEFRGRVFRFTGYARSKSLRSATTAVRITSKHLKELGTAKREEMDAHRSAWESKNPHLHLTSITQVTREKRMGMFYGDVELDFGPRDNRRVAKGTVVLESDEEGITVLAASGPIAGRLLTDFVEGEQRTSLIGGQLWLHGKLPKTLWFLRDGDQTGSDTPTTYVSADPDFDASLTSKFTSPDKPSGKNRTREARRHDSQRRNSEGLEKVRGKNRRGQADEE